MFRRRRLTFKPPKQRRRRSLAPSRIQGPLGWRFWLLIGVLRVVNGAGFALIPSVSLRLGDAALVAMCLVLGGVTAGIEILNWTLTGGEIRRDLASDFLSLVLVVPGVAVAVSIEVADARFGGRSSNFVAASIAILAIYLIIATVATQGWRNRDYESLIGVFPAALIVAAIIGGAGRFSAGNLWQGVSLSWIVAGVGTSIFGLFNPRVRTILTPAVYFGFAIVMVVLSTSSESGELITGSTAALAVLITALAGIVLGYISGGARRARAHHETATAIRRNEPDGSRGP